MRCLECLAKKGKKVVARRGILLEPMFLLLVSPLGHISPLTGASFELCVETGVPNTTPIITRDHNDYFFAKQCLNTRNDIQSEPEAIVRVQSVADVQRVVKCAREYGLEVSTRSGAHSFENESCRGQVILDVSDLMYFHYDKTTQQVTWGSGHTNGQLYAGLSAHNMTFPTGMEGDVGSAGLILGCGRGPITQIMGLSCDRVVGLEYVDHHGNVRLANANENSDMLWMARGGGGEFPGAITKFVAHVGVMPKTVHYRKCDLPGGAVWWGKSVIKAWLAKIEEVAQSKHQMYSYIHFYPNTGTVGVRHKCFDCSGESLAYFDVVTASIAGAGGTRCSAIGRHTEAGSPSEFINMFAQEPGVVTGGWKSLLEKPHYWPGLNNDLFRAKATSGAFMSYTYSADDQLWDDIWELIFNNPPASTSGGYDQQFYFYSIDSDAYTPLDTVGRAYNGAKWILHYRFGWNPDVLSAEYMRQHSRNFADKVAPYFPCLGYYNYIPEKLPCAQTKERLLDAFFSDGPRVQQIKNDHDPDGIFRSRMLSWNPVIDPCDPFSWPDQPIDSGSGSGEVSSGSGSGVVDYASMCPPSPPPAPPQNLVEFIGAPYVGGWGGICTCPDGMSYSVGDNWDSCATLACINGVSGPCGPDNPDGIGVRVTCVPLAVPPSPPAAPPMPPAIPAPKSPPGPPAFPPAAPPKHLVQYIGEPFVGGWGGSCTCPDGTVYQVGDNFDSCASLACINGVSGPCGPDNPGGEGIRVTCSLNDAPPSPPTPPVPPPFTGNLVEFIGEPFVGGWGGTCTCPDGGVYQVGDNFDGCASIACINGISGTCGPDNPGGAGMRVTCSVYVPPSPPAPPPTNVVEVIGAPFVGEWGGTCTCPDGNVYQVGDNFDGCASLACVGGVSGAYCGPENPGGAGVRVTCAAVPAPPSSPPSSPPPPVPPAPPPAPPTPPPPLNVYEYIGPPKVGEWGGVCTCKDGTTYQVGDNWDGCASLACINGAKMSECGENNPGGAGMRVTCGDYP